MSSPAPASASGHGSAAEPLPERWSIESLGHVVSRELRRFKLRCLRNAVLRFGRNDYDTDFYRDLAELLPDEKTACAVCAGAFLADGLDEVGLPIFGGASPFDSLVPTADDSVTGEDDDDYPFPMGRRDNGMAPSSGGIPRGTRPFRNGAAWDTVRCLWLATRGFESLVRAFADRIEQTRGRLAADHGEEDVFARNLCDLAELLHLSILERDVLSFLHLFYSADADWFRAITPSPFPSPRGRRIFTRIIARCLDTDEDAVAQALSPHSTLCENGVVDPRDLELFGSFREFLSGRLSKAPVRSLFYREESAKPLPWCYYPAALREKAGPLETLVRAVRGRRGLNVLLHGVPGSGKTSFAQSFAERLGMRCLSVIMDTQTCDRDDIASNIGEQAAFRLGAIGVAERNCNPASQLLVIDESDALLANGGTNRLNGSFDKARCVRFWLTNLSPSELADSTLRRFDYALSFGPLGSAERLRIWRNSVERVGLSAVLDDTLLGDLAEAYPVSPGVIGRVCDNAAAILRAISPRKRFTREKDGPEAERALRSLLASACETLGVRQPAKGPGTVSRGYILDGLRIRGDVPLAQVIDACRKRYAELAAAEAAAPDTPEADPGPPLNLLLSGPAGTGKTEFVRYLGEKLGRRVRRLSASDLLDKYVGETEQRIRRVFDEASANGDILFLDEADSLLRTRSGAHHSWEVTQVNELLQRMETHRGVLVCATNFLDALDRAVLRRFVFKLRFGYLDDAGKAAFFQRFFGTSLTSEEARELNAIPRLAPGDFRVAAERLRYLSGGDSNARRIAALRDEASQKNRLAPVGSDPEDARTLGFAP